MVATAAASVWTIVFIFLSANNWSIFHISLPRTAVEEEEEEGERVETVGDWKKNERSLRLEICDADLFPA